MYRLLSVDPDTWAFEAVMDDGDTVRFFALNGADRCLVIDSGYFKVDVKDLVRQLLQEQDPEHADKQILLANTHGDYDHTGGNASFEEFFMTREDYDRCGLRETCPQSRLREVEDGYEIELGNRTLQYIMVPGHTYGNAAILDKTNRILFPGDIVQNNNMFMFGEHRCPEKMAASLRRLQSFRPYYDKIYACHGQMVMPADAVDRVIESWDKVINRTAVPERVTVLGQQVDLYRCGFCNFFCDPAEK